MNEEEAAGELWFVLMGFVVVTSSFLGIQGQVPYLVAAIQTYVAPNKLPNWKRIYKIPFIFI